MNNLKVFALMAGLTALFGALGGFIGGQAGMMMALVFAAAMNVAMYWAAPAMVLRMYRARIVTPAEAPELYAMVDRAAPARRAADAHAGHRAARAAQRVRHRPQPGARGGVRDARGCCSWCPRDELEGVIAHELAHIKNRDMLLQTVTATLAGAISNLASFGLFFGGGDDEDDNPFALHRRWRSWRPIAAMVVQMAISRQREFKADAVGAQISGRPHSAWPTRCAGSRRARARIPMHVAPAAAPLAQVNPLAALRGGGVARCSAPTRPPSSASCA